MRQIDIEKRDGRWIGETVDGSLAVNEPTKAEAVSAVRSAGTAENPVTVTVHLLDGTSEERQYPSAP